MATLANALTILMEDIAVSLDHLNLMVLLDNTVPRTIKDNVRLEVEEVLMGIVEEEPVAGPSRPFWFSSLPASL